jgi:hypothetical protein
MSKNIIEWTNTMVDSSQTHKDMIQTEIDTLKYVLEHYREIDPTYIQGLMSGVMLSIQARNMSILAKAKKDGKAIEGVNPNRAMLNLIKSCYDYTDNFAEIMGIEKG